jgi:hypothetical protein
VPVAVLFQKLLLPHVPVGAVPAPAVAPFESQ